MKDLGTANGRSMQLVRCRPGTVFPTHHHRGPEFIYILEGEAIQNGQRLSLGWAGVAETGTLDEHFRSEMGYVLLIVYSECLYEQVSGAAKMLSHGNDIGAVITGWMAFDFRTACSPSIL